LQRTKRRFSDAAREPLRHHAAARATLEIRPSAIHGVGIFAATDIRKGQFVAEGIHEGDYERLVPWSELADFPEHIQRKIMDFCIGTPEGFIPPDDLDFDRLSLEWFFNHSCDGNLGFNDKGDFVALRDIKAGEELTYDYGLAESNPRFEMNCTCASEHCRKRITGNDWRDSGFRRKHLAYMLPRLRQEPTASFVGKETS